MGIKTFLFWHVLNLRRVISPLLLSSTSVTHILLPQTPRGTVKCPYRPDTVGEHCRMTLLHACILLRDFKSFQRVLNVHGRSNQADDQLVKARRTSGTELTDTCLGDVSGIGGQQRSHTKQSNRKYHTADEIHGVTVNVNDKDTDGRTALHLACSLPDCLEYVRLLLKHPLINVNVHDAESHYTPLHRAILLLLQRPDIDVTLKDYEGYSAFDLYNSTIEGTKPDHNDPDADLFMWGTNVNATLGFSDGNHRSHPDQIIIQPKEYASFPPEGPTLWDSFSPIYVHQVGMSKLHTVVVTSEGSSGCNINNAGGGNLRVCGLGSSGRLGPSPYPYNLTHQNPLSSLPSHSFSSNVHITKVAVGQDHTLALTKVGEVYSWGLNRFSQLGYVIKTTQGEPSSGAGGHDEPLGTHPGKNDRTDATGRGNSLDDTIQQTPRRILDALRKEVVVGIAASKMASACWTAKGVLFTWGTNSGQLGYERSSYPHIYPRKVSKIVGHVVDVALSDTAMACLVSTGDVICVWNDKETKINFPLQTFPAKIQPYRPPQALRDAGIAKLTCCDDVFSALSLNGEVFVFTAPDGSIGGSEQASAGRPALIKPQRAWVLKKKYRAVKDVALGSNGNIIVCTESGHVFVRTRAQPIKVASSASQSSDRSGTLPGSGAPGSFTSSSLTGHGSTIMNTPSTAQTSKLGTNFTFVRVPYLQRVTKVCANSTGAFGALKVDYRHAPIKIVGNGIAEDLKELMPFTAMYGCEQWQRMKKGGRFGLGHRKHSTGKALLASSSLPVSSPGDADADDGGLEDIKADIVKLKRLCEIVEQEKKKRKEQDDYTKDRRLPFDADVMVVSQSDAAFPAHRVVLAARSTELCNILAGGKAVKDQTNICVRFAQNKGKAPITTATTTSMPQLLRFPTCGKLIMSGCHTLTILVLLNYLYSDELLALWDPRIKAEMQQEYARLKVKPDQVKTELQTLVRLLHLPVLAEVLDVSVKRAPTPSMAKDMETLWVTTQGDSLRGKLTSLTFPPDTVLQLADREVSCHSVLLRARSDLFASFFGEDVWTMDRRDDQGVIKVDMRHLKWHTMQYVFRFMFCGMEEAQFDRLEFANTVDDVLDFMFSVMAAATELLLDRLVLICSSIILKYINIQNACYILNDATHYNAKGLIERLQTYLHVNLETMLEQRMLDDLPHRLTKQLAAFARQKQAEKSPRSRTTMLVDGTMAKHAEWLSLQDIPTPIIRLSRPEGRGVDITSKRSRLSLGPVPVDSRIGGGGDSTTSQRTLRRPPSGEDIFAMDDAEGPSVTIEPPPKTLGWKPHSVPRVDMKSVMAAEAAATPTSLSRKAVPPISRTGSKDSITPFPGPSVPHGSSTSWRIPANTSPTPTKPTLPSTPPITNTVHGSMTPRKPEKPPPGTSPRETAQIPITPTKSQSSSVTSPARTQRPPPQAATEKDSRPLNLGPIIAPTRQPTKMTITGPPSIRRVSGKAWALPAVEPVITTSPPSPPSSSSTVAAAVQVTATSSGGGGVSSFVAIQQLQLEQGSAGLLSKDNKRSLREIQAEEEARQQEQDFLRWWTAEEERVGLESDAALSRALADSARVDSKGRRKPRAGKKSATNDGKPATTEIRDPNPAAAGHGNGERQHRRLNPRVDNNRAAKI